MCTHTRRIEEATLNAWPALQQVLYDGWILRFAGGYTKRANSITPLFASSIDLATKVAVCERRYRDRNLPTIFRLPSIAAPKGLDQYLAKIGYQKLDPTWVMQMALTNREFRVRNAVELHAAPLESWLEHHGAWARLAPKQQGLHAKILRAIPMPHLFAILKKDGKPVACGLGVLEDEHVGIFDVITAPEERRRGFATELLNGILRWAQARGATCAYLQVKMSNEAAWRMYQKAGFENVYHYWYRMRAP